MCFRDEEKGDILVAQSVYLNLSPFDGLSVFSVTFIFICLLLFHNISHYRVHMLVCLLVKLYFLPSCIRSVCHKCFCIG